MRSTTSGVPKLLLALCSEVSLSSAWNIICDVED